MCVSAGWVWPVGRWRVALRVTGQLRHAVALLPVALRRQPHHHAGHGGDGDGVSGMPGRHQGEQVSAAERECTTITMMQHCGIIIVALPVSLNPDVFKFCWKFVTLSF